MNTDSTTTNLTALATTNSTANTQWDSPKLGKKILVSAALISTAAVIAVVVCGVIATQKGMNVSDWHTILQGKPNIYCNLKFDSPSFLWQKCLQKTALSENILNCIQYAYKQSCLLPSRVASLTTSVISGVVQ